MSASFVDDDPPDPYEDLYENPLNYDVWKEFQNAGPDLAVKLIAMLESREEITDHVRNEIARALTAGLEDKDNDKFAEVGQLQLTVTNDGQRKPGQRLFRELMRRESIKRGKMMKGYREYYSTRSLLKTMTAMQDDGIKLPDKKSQSTIEADEALYTRMRRWIDVEGYPMLWKMRGDDFLAKWRVSPEAEEDFIQYGPD